MRYCVNCGKTYKEPLSVCESCSFDPALPEMLVDAALAQSVDGSGEPEFGYPGERMALGLSIVGAVTVVLVVGAVSVGLFAVLVALSVVQLKLAHVRLQKGMIRASARGFEKVHRLAKLAAYRLRMRCPEVYVSPDSDYNAYTQGFFRQGFLVVNSALVQDFRPAELLFVLGHEMGHVKRSHTTWLTLLNPARAGGTRFLLAPLVEVIFNIWSVKAEYTADQAGLIACGDRDATCRALLKIAGGPQVERHADLEAMVQDQESDTVLADLVEYLGTHPFVKNRLQHVGAYEASGQFARACWWRNGRV